MREVFEHGMRAYVAGTTPSKPFRLRTITTKGQGLARPLDWAESRELIYEGQGGEREAGESACPTAGRGPTH